MFYVSTLLLDIFMEREANKVKLKGYKNIKGTIEVITGLHVGGSATTIEIGGRDNPVIKHPVTNEPYIPGSSIKGKMRSLLEWQKGFIDSRRKIDGEKNKDYGMVHKYGGHNCKKQECPICIIFGTSADNAGLGPTRLIVRDAFLNKDYREQQKEKPGWTPLSLTEDKWENTINRITAGAIPRNIERVIPGAKFELDISFKVFENGDGEASDEELFKHVIEGLKLIERDTLGGSGSRGCGQVKFTIKVDGAEKTIDDVNPEDFVTVG